VATDTSLGVRKYHVNRWRFLNELRVLPILQTAGCRVPSLLGVDFDRLSITSTYVAGLALREALAERAAVVRDRDVITHSPFKHMTKSELWRARIREGKRVLYDVIDRTLADNIHEQIRTMHRARVIWGDVKFGNIVIDEGSGQPYLIDFDAAGHFPLMPQLVFDALRDREIASYRLHFDPEVPV
jgi:tRNA A-37 threonylcarbamoyl transferase component Bud32